MAVYFDHNATTPIHGEVFKAMEPYLKENYGNPSCLYRLGVDASYGVEKSRRQIARLIQAKEDAIIFTGCGTEANNLAIKGTVLAGPKRHIITSCIEHPAVIKTCQFLEQYFDCRVTYLPVDSEGRVDPQSVQDAITDDTAIVSIMLANNETGVIQPIVEISEITNDRGVVFHTDAIQGAGKIPIDVDALGVSLLSLTGHKIYAPKGVGALYVRNGIQLVAQMNGGSQESGLRGGTENVASIAGMGKAAELARKELDTRSKYERHLRDLLWEKLSMLPIEVIRNSPMDHVLPGTLNVSVRGLNSREFVRAMDDEGFCLSTGSACSQGKTTPSYVIKALGRSDEEAAAAIRFSLGYQNSEEEIDAFLEAFPRVLKRIRSGNG